MFLISEEYILSVGRTEEKFIFTREIRCISFDLVLFSPVIFKEGGGGVLKKYQIHLAHVRNQ